MSLHVEHEAFEVLALGMIDADGVVGRLVELMEDAHVATATGSGGEDGEAELLLIDGLRTAEGEEDAAGADTLEGDGVEARIALDGAAHGVAVFGESGRVKDDEVEG